MDSTILIILLVGAGAAILDIIAIFIINHDYSYTTFQKFYRILIVLFIPVLGALYEFKCQSGVTFGSSGRISSFDDSSGDI